MTPKSPSIRDNPRPDLRRKLLDSAERLFSERAYEDVRVDDIADDAGVAKGLISYHFDGKRGLYIAVIKAMAEDVSARTVPDLSLPFYDSVAAAIDSFLEWTVEIERFSKAVSSGPGTDPVLTNVIEETLELQVERILAGMKLATAQLDIDQDMVDTPMMRHTIRGWVAYVYAVAVDWMATHDVPAEALRDLYVRALAGAIQAARDSSIELDAH